MISKFTFMSIIIYNELGEIWIIEIHVGGTILETRNLAH